MSIETAEFSDQLAKQYLETIVFAFDIETDTDHYHWKPTQDRGLSYTTDVTLISFAADDLPTLVLCANFEWMEYTTKVLNLDTAQLEERTFTRRRWFFSEDENKFIRTMFSREQYTAVAHNLVFDARQIFGKWGLAVPANAVLWDTQAIQYTGGWLTPLDFSDDEALFGENESDEDRQNMSLLSLTSDLFDAETIQWWDKLKPLRRNLTKFLTDENTRSKKNITYDDLISYSAMDSVAALKLYYWQQQQIPKIDDDQSLDLDPFEMRLKIDLDYTKLCVQMSVNGIRLNRAYVEAEREKYLSMWIKSLEGFGLTAEEAMLPRSAAWKKNYIFSTITEQPSEADIQLFKLKSAKTGAWSFAKGPMAYYIEKYPELMAYRRHVDLETKLKRIDEFIRHSEYDGRLHSLTSRLALTGRNTSGAPNIQNLALKYKVKLYEGIPALDVGYLIPDEDKVFISLDCSNAENWMGAMYGRDNNMALACSKTDFHTEMASTAYFPEEWKTATPERRQVLRGNGKTISFGTAYGMGVAKLAVSLMVSKEEAQQFLDRKDRAFPMISDKKAAWTKFAEANGYCVLWTGRKIRMRKKAGKYKGYTAWNSLAQGGVGELIVRGMLDIQKSLPEGARVVTQVHDEIVIEFLPDQYRSLVPMVIETLSTIIPDKWNQRTTPNCRWLFDLCNRTNAKKWGYVPGQTYPLPLDEYVNRWGFHKYDSDKQSECPVWINQYGYGTQALEKELGVKLDEQAEKVYQEPAPTFDWERLRLALVDASSTLNPFNYEERLFDYANGMEVRRSLCHKGVDNSYLTILTVYDTLTVVLDDYKKFLEQGGKKC